MLTLSLDLNKDDKKFINSSYVEPWILSTKILEKKFIGHGSFGNVYRVVLDNNEKTILAQKESKKDNIKFTDDFIREFGTLKKLATSSSTTGVDRLIKLIGIKIGSGHQNGVVSSIFTPYYKYGNLSTFLKKNRLSLTICQWRQMSNDVCGDA